MKPNNGQVFVGLRSAPPNLRIIQNIHSIGIDIQALSKEVKAHLIFTLKYFNFENIAKPNVYDNTIN